MFAFIKLTAEELETVLLEVEELLTGPTQRRGRSRVNYGYRSTDTFPTLNKLVYDVASPHKHDSSWTNECTWAAIEKLLRQVPDDDFQQPELLAAKILTGLRKPPGWEEFVPMPGLERYGKSPLVPFHKLRNSPEVTFENSITLRRKYAAPLLRPGSTEQSTFRKSRANQRYPGPLRKVAATLLEKLLEEIAEGVPLEAVSDEIPMSVATDKLRNETHQAHVQTTCTGHWGIATEAMEITNEWVTTALDLLDNVLPRLAETGSAYFGEAGLLPADTLKDMQVRIRLLHGVRATLDRLNPEVFSADLDSVLMQISNARSRTQSIRAERRAKKLLRPGIEVESIEKVLKAARAQRIVLSSLGTESRVTVPVGLGLLTELYSNAVELLALLFTGLEVLKLEEVTLEELDHRVREVLEHASRT